MSLGKRIQGEGHPPIIGGGGGSSSTRRVCRKINSHSTRKHRHLHRRTKAVSSILRSSDSKYSKNSSSSFKDEESTAVLFEPPKYPLATLSPNRLPYFVPTRTTTTISNIPKQPDCRCCDCSCNDDDSNSSSTSWSSSSSSSSVDSCGSSSITTATSEVVTSPITTTPSSRKRCDKTTRFYNKVIVVRIPSRHTYPSDMKRTMWSSMKEIHANAKRNTIEFASDGWDWRNATEENEFYQNPASGESVHPIHIVMHRRRRKRQQLQQQQRRQLMEREAAKTVQQHCS